jgi:hypothetical protein
MALYNWMTIYLLVNCSVEQSHAWWTVTKFVEAQCCCIMLLSMSLSHIHSRLETWQTVLVTEYSI